MRSEAVWYWVERKASDVCLGSCLFDFVSACRLLLFIHVKSFLKSHSCGLWGSFVAGRELMAQWGVSHRRELMYSHMGGNKLSASDSVLQTGRVEHLISQRRRKRGERGTLLRHKGGRKSGGHPIGWDRAGRNGSLSQSDVNGHKQLHLLWISCPPPLAQSPSQHTQTHRHTQALAPWEMKMDDEHLAKQGWNELKR